LRLAHDKRRPGTITAIRQREIAFEILAKMFMLCSNEKSLREFAL